MIHRIWQFFKTLWFVFHEGFEIGWGIFFSYINRLVEGFETGWGIIYDHTLELDEDFEDGIWGRFFDHTEELDEDFEDVGWEGGYEVAGAGDGNINGLYFLAGISNGKNYYTYGSYFLFWVAAEFWVINNVMSLPDSWQYIASVADDPPLAGWSVGASGTGPAGTLTAL